MSPNSDKASDPEKSAPWNSELASGEKMQRLDRLANLGMLSAGMAHEIKNGMVAVKTFVDLLVEKNQDAELGEIVGHEMDRINAIVTQMLRMASPVPAAFRIVRVHGLLDHSLRLVEHQISGKLISLERDYRAAPDTVRGDEFQLQQAFMNLLFNAIEAIGANGALTVSTDTMGRQPIAGFKSATRARASRRKTRGGYLSHFSRRRKTGRDLV